jgi:lipoprotein-releasing system permease protein
MIQRTSLPRRIAKRLAGSHGQSTWSKPVVQIATAGVTIGIALIVIATSIVHGFQSEVKELVVGFGSDIQVLNGDWRDQKIIRSEKVEQDLRALSNVKSVSPFYTSPGIVESKSGLKGVVLKGMSLETSNGMLEKFLLEGRVPRFDGRDTVVLSLELAQRLELELHDQLTIYLIGGPTGIRPRTMVLGGIYRTGLIEYDEEFMFVPAQAIQSTAGWGMDLQLVLSENTVEARAFGGNRSPKVSWREVESDGRVSPLSWSSKGAHSLSEVRANSIMAIAESRDLDFNVLPDTAWLSRAMGVWKVEPTGSGWDRAASGYEIYLEDAADLWTSEAEVYAALPLGLVTETVTQQAPEMFTWLGMLDLNVEIIIGLMVLISIINMTSALLILILERRPMIGMLKALGMSDGQVLRVFLWQAARILGKGFWMGNVAGLSVVYLQEVTGWVGLNPEAYYLSEVPVQLNAGFLIAVEVLIFVLCVAMMFFPALASTRIRPADALRVNR